MKACPFCGSKAVEFTWTSFMAHGRVECKNWQNECCAQGPQAHRLKRWDNEKRLINRAIKAWDKRNPPQLEAGEGGG